MRRAAFTLVVSRGKAAGFTLVELLVVMGVAAVIMSLLLATLTSARESARRTACLSNLRQIGTAIVMYANDNAGLFPSSAMGGSGAFQPDDWIWWRSAERPRIREGGIGRYLGLGPDNYGVLTCPSDGSFRLRTVPEPYCFSYTTNFMFAARSNAPILYKRVTRVRNASEKVLAYEEDERTIDDGNGSLWLPRGAWRLVNLLAIRHDKTRIEQPDLPTEERPVPNGMRQGNVVFADGHAAYVSRRLCHSKLHALGNPSDYPNDPDYYP
jgi:prepilin-type N-terminal cleavage/methylation domain-containing protein/prepilin-type processing-associated H-X9-DG protein